jgi:hypothetical protein
VGQRVVPRADDCECKAKADATVGSFVTHKVKS